MSKFYYPPERIEQVVGMILDNIADNFAASAVDNDAARGARRELQGKLAEPFIRWLLAQQNAGAEPPAILAAVESVVAWIAATTAGMVAGADRENTAIVAAHLVNGIGLSVGAIVTSTPDAVINAEIRN